VLGNPWQSMTCRTVHFTTGAASGSPEAEGQVPTIDLKYAPTQPGTGRGCGVSGCGG
jgi:hypothetical protein